ncbi:hypothetical protein GF357_02440 [Candidatus Dojkabacteria bacterium]|nr:hypothetical protein [Candidatus Dojkabacteria bacterium]
MQNQKIKKEALKETILYVLSGLITYLTDTMSFALLVEVVKINKYYANILSFSFALVISYFLNALLVFKKNSASRIISFFASTFVVNLIFSNLFLFVLSDRLGVNYLISKNFSILVVFIVNYLVRKFLIFNSTQD